MFDPAAQSSHKSQTEPIQITEDARSGLVARHVFHKHSQNVHTEVLKIL
jgi:hypothetical protein